MFAAGRIECALARAGYPLEILFQTRQHRDGALRVRSDPAFMDGVDGQRVEVIPALPPAPFGDDQVGVFQHLQMLHHGASVDVLKQGAQLPRGQRLIAKRVEQ